MNGWCVFVHYNYKSVSVHSFKKIKNLKGFGGEGGAGGRMYYVHHRPHQMGLLQQH